MMFKPAFLRAALLASACAFASASPAFAQQQTQTFNIAAGDLSSALEQYMRQAGVELVYSRDAVAGRTTQGLQGNYTREEALQRLLEGSGLQARRDSSGAILVADAVSPTQLGAADAASSDDEEIVVTGTRIRGHANATSPFQAYDREEIQSGGFTTTEDFIRSVPQSFGGGQLGGSPDGLLGAGSQVGRNTQGASSINLRGLGENSTLTLVNGHRLAPSVYGGIVDVSAIPIGAIERVEVVADGASAIYGADAVAGVVNFWLRDDFEGAETEIRFGTVTEGDHSQETVAQTIGHAWQGGSILGALQYQHQTSFDTADRPFTEEVLDPTDIYPERTAYTGLLNLNLEPSDRIDLFADLLLGSAVSRRDNTNTFASDTTKTESEFVTLHAGARYTFDNDWILEASTTGSRTRLDSWKPFREPPIDGLPPGDEDLNTEFSLFSVDTSASGSLLQLPGGSVEIALGASYREEEGSIRSFPLPESRADRAITSVFAEVLVPLVGDHNALPGIRALELSGAVRYDDYSDFGDTTNPKLGVRWAPIDDLSLRGSWSQSFRAPTFAEDFDSSVGFGVLILPFAAPDGIGSVPTFALVGSRGDLQAETSESWSVGADFEPEAIPNLSLHATYFHVDFRNRIVTPPADLNALTQPAVYGSLISTLPDDAAADAFLADVIAQGGFVADLVGTGSADVRFVYNDLTQNAAYSIQDGLDVELRYLVPLLTGDLLLRGNIAFINKIETAFAEGADPTDVVNTYANPPRFRSRADATWTTGQWQLNGALNYTGEYTDTTVTPQGDVEAYVTYDLSVRYDFGAEASNGNRSSLRLTIANVFDEAPPFVGGIGQNAGVHYDVGNADPRGRFVSLQLIKVW